MNRYPSENKARTAVMLVGRVPLPVKPPKVERPVKGKGSYTRKVKHKGLFLEGVV